MNDFYTPPADIPSVSRAKAIQINDLRDSVDAGFDAVETELDGYLDTIEAAKTIAVDSAAASTTSASEAADSASDAAASATAADEYTTSLSGTSTTSKAVGDGAKTFTVESGKNFSQGQFISIISDADSDNYMHGAVTSYSGTTLVVAVSNSGGTGTFSDWSISVSGSQGEKGDKGDESGYFTPLYSVTASSAASVEFDSFPTGYDEFMIESLDCYCSATAAEELLDLTIASGSPLVYKTAGYCSLYSENGSNLLTVTNSAFARVAKLNPSLIGRGHLAMRVGGLSAGSLFSCRGDGTTQLEMTTTRIPRRASSRSVWNGGTDAVTGIKLAMETGTYTITGTFNVYGVHYGG